MRTITLLMLLFLAPVVSAQVPSPNRNELVELPADFTVSSKQRTVKLTAKVNADPKDVSALEWVIDNIAVDDSGSPLVIDYDVVDARTIRLFLPDAQDTIRVGMYCAVKGIPTKFITCVITVGVPKKPGPAPNPAPSKSGKVAAHATFVVGASNSALADSIAADAGLQQFLNANAIKLHKVADDSPVAKAGFAKAIASVGGSPCVVLQGYDKASGNPNDGNVIDAVRLTDAVALRVALERHTK